MEQFCAYCGDRVLGAGIQENQDVFCCEECLDAYNEEALLFLDQDESDDL